MGTILMAVALIVCGRWFFRSELPEAIADSMRSKHGGGLNPAVMERIDELADRMDEELGELRADLVELGERMEFTERILTDVRGSKALGETRAAQ